MVFFLANCGMRVGELVKVKRKDVQFYQLQERADEWMNGKNLLLSPSPSINQDRCS